MADVPQEDHSTRESIGNVLGRIPAGLFVLTARHEERAAGMLASWVQQVCFEPPMLMIAIAKGRPIMPLISESRRFALCQLAQGDRLMLRRFTANLEDGEDPFLGMDLISGASNGPPVLAHCLGYLECEVSCHMDVEGDHDLFVGRINKGAFFGGEPDVRIRTDGFKY